MYQDTSVSAFVSGIPQTLGPKTFWYLFSKKLKAPLGFLILAVIAAVIRTTSLIPVDLAGSVQTVSRVLFALAIISLVIAYFAAKVVFKNTGFTLDEDALKLHRGTMTKEEYSIPYHQIQNIEIQRTMALQSMGLSRFIILTAGQDEEVEDEPEGIIPAIDKDVAINLQKELLRRASIQKVVQA